MFVCKFVNADLVTFSQKIHHTDIYLVLLNRVNCKNQEYQHM